MTAATTPPPSSANAPPAVSCVVPVHDEEASVAETLRGVEAALRACCSEFEILVVDDGSRDASARAVAECGVPLRLLRHETNRGYGAALVTGFRHARHPWVLFLDADGSYPPEQIDRLIAPLADPERAGTLDMIVGARTQTRSTDPSARLVGKAILLAFARYLSGERIPDINSGMRVVRATELARLRPLFPPGFSLTTTVTLALLCGGGGVRFVPIDYRARAGHSKIRPLRDMAGFLALIARTTLYFRPLRVFLPLGSMLVVAAFLVVILSKALSPHQVMDVTALFLFIAGLQMFLIGIVADLILKLAGIRDRG